MRRVALVASVWLSIGCAAPQRANLAYLQYRAVFDLGCPAQALVVYHIDERTKAVAGCGKRLVYLEHCDGGAGNTCSWELDTPSFAQTQWPAQQTTAQQTTAQQATAPQATVPQATAPQALPQPQGRSIPTELFGPRRTAPSRDATAQEPFPVQPATTPAPASDGQPF